MKSYHLSQPLQHRAFGGGIYKFVNLRTSEIHLFYNLQVFYWHFLEILWLFIFLILYLFSRAVLSWLFVFFFYYLSVIIWVMHFPVAKKNLSEEDKDMREDVISLIIQRKGERLEKSLKSEDEFHQTLWKGFLTHFLLHFLLFYYHILCLEKRVSLPTRQRSSCNEEKLTIKQERYQWRGA